MAERPNFLFVFDDQHRYDYPGAAGADPPFVRTSVVRGPLGPPLWPPREANFTEIP